MKNLKLMMMEWILVKWFSTMMKVNNNNNRKKMLKLFKKIN